MDNFYGQFVWPQNSPQPLCGLIGLFFGEGGCYPDKFCLLQNIKFLGNLEYFRKDSVYDELLSIVLVTLGFCRTLWNRLNAVKFLIR